MKRYNFSSTDALTIAREIQADGKKSPVLVLIKAVDWKKLNNKDKVVSISDDNINIDTLEDLKQKDVVFCHYTELDDIEFISWNWKSFVEGATVEVEIG